MKAHPAVGDFYRQEFSLANAEDWAETISLTETVTVVTGTYTNCLQSQETTPLEPDLLEHKFYAPGVGNVLTSTRTPATGSSSWRSRRSESPGATRYSTTRRAPPSIGNLSVASRPSYLLINSSRATVPLSPPPLLMDTKIQRPF